MASKLTEEQVDEQLLQFEAPAKRFGSVRADLNVRPLRTGFQSINQYRILRAERPDLCVIGARPGNGKTSFLVQVLRNIARQEGQHTLMFSLEMATDQLVLRALAAQVGCPTEHLGRLSENKIRQAEETLNLDDFFVDDTSGLEINQLRSRAMAYKQRFGLAAIGVDYLQIVAADGGDKRTQVGNVAMGLKHLAKDIGVPVIALAQMSREIEKRQQLSKTARPVMSDLQECSLVENWADQILFLDGAGKRDPSRAGEIDGYLVKNRHGPVGDFVLQFDGTTTRFSDFEPQGI